MNKRQVLAAAFRKSGGIWLLDRWWGAERLTVLAYHRICDPHAPDFDGFEANVSATPAMFARQMDYVQRHFNVVDLAALHAYVVYGQALPPRPLLITFDDGYRDNYEHAYPVLRARGLPAVFFIVPDWVGSARRPWWDRCAYLFAHTTQTRAELPLIGTRDITDSLARRAARYALIEQLKTLPESEKQQQIDALAAALEVAGPGAEPSQAPAPLFMTWNEVREVVANGIACQPHTLSHPILTRIPPEQARAELTGSAARLAKETGQPVTAFAYPNGTINDYNPAIMQHLRVLDIPLAFTLTPGPLALNRVRAHALEIPRVFLIYKDTFDMFAAKVMGVPALLEQRQFLNLESD